jgi:cob(I)alamin adenosyltransferase
LVAIQEVLFAVGAALADPEGRMEHDSAVWGAESLEQWIDAMDVELEPLSTFILPGGRRTAALSHVVRTVCRRAERRVCEMGEPPKGLLAYLNRLSDAFFTLARFVNVRAGISETAWRP